MNVCTHATIKYHQPILSLYIACTIVGIHIDPAGAMCIARNKKAYIHKRADKSARSAHDTNPHEGNLNVLSVCVRHCNSMRYLHVNLNLIFIYSVFTLYTFYTSYIQLKNIYFTHHDVENRKSDPETKIKLLLIVFNYKQPVLVFSQWLELNLLLKDHPHPNSSSSQSVATKFKRMIVMWKFNIIARRSSPGNSW